MGVFVGAGVASGGLELFKGPFLEMDGERSWEGDRIVWIHSSSKEYQDQSTKGKSG